MPPTRGILLYKTCMHTPHTQRNACTVYIQVHIHNITAVRHTHAHIKMRAHTHTYTHTRTHTHTCTHYRNLKNFAWAGQRAKVCFIFH